MSQQIFLELMDHLCSRSLSGLPPSEGDGIAPKQDVRWLKESFICRSVGLHDCLSQMAFCELNHAGSPPTFPYDSRLPPGLIFLADALFPSFPVGSQRSLMFVTGHDRWKPLSPRGSEALLNWKLQMKSVGFKFISYYARWPLAAADKNERMLAVIQFSTLSTP